MNQKLLYALWGGLFSLCAGLGFIPEPEGFERVLLTLLSLAFFLPPAAILYGSGQKADRHAALLIRNLSALSLSLTLVLLIVNFFTAFSSTVLGQVMHYVLVVVSSPMICSGYWAMSLFLWACLLMGSMRLLRR